MSLCIEDISVHLSSKGSSEIISADSAKHSKSIQNLKNHVRIDPIIDKPPEARPMTWWPFKTKPKEEIKPSESEEIKKMIHDMNQKTDMLLQLILAKGSSNVSAEILEAISKIQFVSSSKPSTLKSDTPEPMFIPSKIIPKDVESNINTKEKSMEAGDLNAAREALKKARQNKQK